MRVEAPRHIVRGYGPLDLYLAKKRCKMAAWHLRDIHHRHRIIDIGCGAYPLFLTQIDFAEKYGVDKEISNELQDSAMRHGIVLKEIDLQGETVLPWRDNSFDAVSMLAVIEHIEPDFLPSLLDEIYRVLKTQGRFILTTPAPWTDILLRFMAKLKIISEEEIRDHKGVYSHKILASYMSGAGFTKDKMKFGYFELFFNIWAIGDK